MEQIAGKQNRESLINSIQEQSQFSSDAKFQFSEDIIEHTKIKLGKKSSQSIVIHLFNSSLNSSHLIYILRSSLTNSKLINISIIKKLYLSRNQISDEGIKQLCRKQYQWKVLQKLDLSNNNITMNGVQYLSKAAEMKLLSQLSQLQLAFNCIGGNKAFLESINNKQQSQQDGLLLKFGNYNSKLKRLLLSQNKITDQDILKLFKSKENNKTNNNQIIFHFLQTLNLHSNQIAKCEIKPFAKGLSQQYPLLKNLYLNKNKINKDGIKYLVNFNHQNQINKKGLSILQKLALDNNNLCSQSIKILVSNNNQFSNLKSLWLSQNHFITDQAINYLMKSFQQERVFPSLQIIIINNLSDKGIQYMIKQYNPQKNLVQFKIDLIQSKVTNLKLSQNKLKQGFGPKIRFILFQD